MWLVGARRLGGLWSLMAGLLAVFWISLVGGCAGDPPKPAPAVTPEQVRGHADKTFEKLKQEEQQRGGDPGTPR
jgi:hypothetical protein